MHSCQLTIQIFPHVVIYYDSFKFNVLKLSIEWGPTYNWLAIHLETLLYNMIIYD